MVSLWTVLWVGVFASFVRAPIHKWICDVNPPDQKGASQGLESKGGGAGNKPAASRDPPSALEFSYERLYSFQDAALIFTLGSYKSSYFGSCLFNAGPFGFREPHRGQGRRCSIEGSSGPGKHIGAQVSGALGGPPRGPKGAHKGQG